MSPAALTVPSPADLRLLSRSALALWRAIVRERDRQGTAPRDWFGASLRELRLRARIGYSTAKRALASLRRAGLVHTLRELVAREVSGVGAVRAKHENLYAAEGRADRDGSIAFPRSWLAYAAAARSGAAWRPRRPSDPGPSAGPEYWESQIDSAGLIGKGEPSTIVSSKGRPGRDSLREALRGIFATSREEDQADLRGERCGALLDLLAGDGRPRVATGPRRPGYARVRPEDRHELEPSPVLWPHDEMPDAVLARMAVDGYRRAVKAVLGAEWWHYSRGEITKAKGYAGLVAFGRACCDHAVSPEHWAIWRLEHARRTGRTRGKAPPISVVMSAKFVSENAGWWRKDYDLPVRTFKPDRAIAEQRLRNEESVALHCGVPLDLQLFRSPRWYGEKRRAEIDRGIDDPLDDRTWPVAGAVDWSTVS